MPVEMLQHTARQPTKAAVGGPPPRLRAKGKVGPQFYRQSPTAQKQSAVERLEADKAKYVKSQVALSKQQLIRPTELPKPQLIPAPAVRTTRIASVKAAPTKVEGMQLDLEHLSNLISDVTATAESPRKTPAVAPPVKEKPLPPPRPDRSSPARVRLKVNGPARADGAGGAAGSPAAGAIRRVDVVPEASPQTSPCRPLQFMRQPLKPMPLHAQVLLRPAAARLRLFPTKPLDSSPLKPVAVPKPDNSPPSSIEPPAFPPPSPAVTRLSSTSSRKRPSLTRSKSDMSDRYSRAGTELERFFNLCGVDAEDLQELTGSNADIVSLARFRSVSAPGSECSGSRRGEEEEQEEDDEGKAAERVPYGVSVIERNARVIKWLYGLRQAKDNTTKSTNL